MSSWFGLPAHPFLVHVPLVLGPLVAAAAIVVALWPAARRRYGWAVLGASAVVLVFTVLATRSGESLERTLRANVLVRDHQRLGDASRAFVFGLFVLVAVVVVGSWWLERRRQEPGWARPARLALGALTTVVGLLVIVWMIRTGHTGAEAVWKETTRR